MPTKSSTYRKNLLKSCLAFLLLFAFNSINAQLSDLHYLPPMKQGQNNQGIRQQAVYLSTPEPVTFAVNVYRGTNTTPVATYNISNLSPAVYTLGNGDNNITLVNNANTGVVLNNAGLRFESPSGNRFYVNYRGYSSSQAASLTSKGRVAMGTRFKWGGVPNLGSHPSKSNTLGIMATEDNTTVQVFGYDPDCQFRVGNNVAGITADTYTVNLDANESFVFETYIGNNPTQAHEDGWIGASVISDKDIVISNGSINYGRQAGASNRDAGIDQPVPENRLGKDYVFIRGNGNANGLTEFPLIIAIADNTQIFVNGSATPIATIDNGEYFQVPSSYYSSNTVGANMFVQTSKDVYAYQCMAGDSKVYTQGLNFVAPVNCLLPDVMDNIPDIRNMAGTLVNGGLTIIAAVNTPDANIMVTDGNGPVTLPPSNPVAGTTDWKTFFIPNLNGNVSVQSTGPMAIGFFGYNGARGVAGYFSGFDTVPEVTLEIRGGSGCFVGSTIFEATGNFDAYQWYGDGQMIPGENGPSYAPAVAGDYFVRGTKGPCTYDSQPISAYYCDPDVVMEKTVDKAEITEGETATFTIKVRNLGVGPLTNLQITDDIPAGLTLQNAFTITGSWSGNTWNIGTLNGGETAFLELEVLADPIDTLPLLRLANTAVNTQDQPDTNISQDHPTALLTVHNDFDNDGVVDSVDLDDDNDGVYDTEECVPTQNNLALGGTVTMSSTISGGAGSNAVDNDTNGNFANGSVAQTNTATTNEWVSLDLGSNQYLDEIVLWNRTDCCSDRLSNAYLMVSENPFPASTNLDDALANAKYAFQFGNTTGQTEIRTFIGTQARYIRVQKSGNNINGDALSIAEIQAIQNAVCNTDGDALPNQLDLDSDGDGCTDANEFYKDNNADGGDGGEYGSGVPVVNPTDGTVNAASYTAVFAPEILLGNTTEDLGGTDINGQGVNLGESFQYVLRFQNTGDDNAVNYTIRDILPANVTLDNVDVSGALGTTHTHDINTNTIVFQVPDNLVEVGDPEYTIRITVTVSGNCSDFVNACSAQLENLAYSTFEGVLNPTVFTDEAGSSNFPCNTVPEVASNNILDDLANCNQARTVQLCGNDVILSAGSGFNTYNWALDNNGNGSIDAADTLLNDGDPDGDPSTLIVTDIGNYIVEKSGASGCPDLVELITVERFGTTQTNPIIDYFNQVNADGDPDNDLQGEIASCAIDGSLLPKIFLCGENDEATIQLGITDADSIIWQQLDETSCSDAGDDCANTDGSCTWNNLATQPNYTVTDSGRYRVVINYQNGCFSRFYFNVFKNTLDILHTASDILCSTPGNIRITNIGTNYGFQLVDASNNNIVVPFADDNGPDFNINSSGTYKVQVTQLNPLTGDPISGGCIFETEDIGILERDYQVDLSSTPADCNQLGTITVQALNVLPLYHYELRLDDGSNGGQGTFIDNRLATTDNTHTFTNVNPGDYIVITTTDDGCSDTQQIRVDEIPELTLTALTAENITCTAGIVTLTPSGGNPNPDYQMAIWSKDGADLYASPADIPASALQTATNFLFGYRGTPTTYFPNEDGDYEFIVFDNSGCSAISNTVTVEEPGGLSLSAAHSGIVCADSSTASLTVSVTGGTTPYQYSLDGGSNYQTSDTFVNLPAGFYTITVMDSSGNGGSGCVETLDYEIDQPFRLTASAAIVEDASCNPAGASVKILNANGGQAPYEYSFDGGSNFDANHQRFLLPGDYQLIVQDALGCTFNMDLTVPVVVPDPDLTTALDYACDGLGTLTVSTSNTTDFTYTYALDGTPNSPADNNVFTNLTDGSYVLTVGYSSSITPAQSTLFFENFGSGPTTQIGEIGPGYCYEPQDGSTTPCNLGPAGILVNGEYTVTNFVTNPIPGWLSPNDHTGLADGRFLAIDVSTLAGDNGILWARRGIEVLANRDITLSFWAYNLLITSANGNNPDVLIELVDTSGTVLATATTGDVPKNNNADDWHNFTFNLNPGANTVVDIVLRTNLNSDFGNDLILDDIEAFQLPEVCERTQDIAVVIEPDQAFAAQFLSVTEPSCNGTSDGAIRFEVSNFDAVAGFEYSLDGGTNWIGSTSSPVTTAATLADGNYSVLVRKADDNSCSVSFPATLTEPAALVPGLSITTAFSCFNTGATLEASVSGGSPGYEYQLEDTVGGIVVAYQTNNTFTNIPDGDYLVRVRDNNNCEALSAAAVTVDPLQAISFTTTSTACYDGSNNATITVNVTSGNGDYTFRIDGGAWLTPTPATATTYTFNGLADGSYNIEVADSYGCAAGPQLVDIESVLTATVDTVDVTGCADGSITINASGGDGTYVYAFLTSGSTVLDTDFVATNSTVISSATAGSYDVYVRDNSGSSPYCQYMETVTVANAAVLAFNTTFTDPECHDGMGSIDVNITSGDGPYTIEIVDLDNGGASDQTVNNVLTNNYAFLNLLAGDYTIIITDTHGCSLSDTPITINNPDELVGTVSGVTPMDCSGTSLDFGFDFSGYPTTIGTVEFSDDAGASWQSSDQFRDYISGETVNPSLRTVDGLGNTICQTDLPPFIIPYPLDDLDITISAVVYNCNELRVVVQGDEGTPGYEYAYSEDPANFDPITATWIAGGSIDNLGMPVPAGHGRYEWTGLVPGRTYTFYVRDGAGCVRQSNVNVNNLITQPLGITSVVTPSCSGSNNGSITYTIVENTVSPGSEMQWSFYDISTGTPVLVSNSGGNVPFSDPQTLTFNTLGTGNYFVEVTKMDGAVASCVSASENELLEELDALTGTPAVTQDIACDRPGLIEIPDISGGGGIYYFDVSGPAPFTPISGTLDNPIEIPANSPGGSYSISVSDQYGCTLSLGSVNLNLAANPTIDDIVIDNCGTLANLTITASSTAAQIFYSVDGGVNYLNNGGLFTNLATGAYTVSIIDSNGCTASSPITIHQPLQATALLDTTLGCGAGNEAGILIEVSSGSGSYDYEVLGSSSTLVSRQTLATNPTTVVVATADTYTVNVYDTNTASPECSRTFTIEVPAATQPSFTADPMDVSCSGASDGIIAITEDNNGISPLTYSLNPNVSTFNSTTNSFENLPPGNYEITATGQNGCSTVLSNIPIAEPNQITFDVPAVSPFGCAAGNSIDNASVTINTTSIAGGSGNYVRYEFIDNTTSAVLQSGTNAVYLHTNYAAVDVLVRVVDDNGCSAQSLVSIPAFDELLSASITVDDAISCSTLDEDISIDVTGSLSNYGSAPANYEFRLLPSLVYQSSNQFAGLPVGNHTFGIRNVNTGCEITIGHLVEDPNTFDITVEKLADAVCFGDNGSVRFTLVDASYTGGFSWNIFDTNGTPADRTDDGPAILSGNSATNGPTTPIAVPAGNYLVEISQDASPACSQVRAFSITTPPAPITLSPLDLVDVGCTNDQGSVLIAPLGGQGPYTIDLTHVGTATTTTATSVSSHLFDGLSAGQYTITVVDALGCSESFVNAFELLLPDPITGSISNTAIVCQGDTDASVTISLNPRNVITNYRFVLNTYDDMAGSTLLSASATQTAQTFSNLGAGFYSITAIDDMDCTFETGIVEIIEPTDVDALLVTNQQLSCQLQAELLLVASGGTGPYSWSTDGISFTPMNETLAADTHLFQNIAAGNYRYYIRDSFNCVSTLSNEISIEAIEDLDVSVDLSAAQVNCNGDSTALIEAVASGGMGNYLYALFSDQALTNEIRPNQNNGRFADLPTGTYYVRVQSEDCEASSIEIQIDEPDTLVVNTTISDISCSGADDGSILLDAQGGSGDYQYAISPNLNQFDSVNLFEDLSPGDYSVIVQDSNGCFEFIEFSLTEPDALTVSSTVTDEICFESSDGTITLQVSGGTAPYRTSLNSIDPNNFVEGLFSYEDLPSGTHVVFIRDANDCEITEAFVVEPGVNLAGEARVTYECNESGFTSNSVQVVFEDSSVLGDVLYGLDTDDPNLMQLDPVFEGLSGGSHTITVIHSNGCTNAYDFEVTIFEPLTLQLAEGDINLISAVAVGGSGNYTFSLDDGPGTSDSEFYITETRVYSVTVTDENGCSITQEIFMEFIDIEIPYFFTPDGDGRNDIWKPENIEQFPNIFVKIFDRYGRTIYQFKGNEDGWDGQYQLNELPTGDYWYIIKLNGIEDDREFVGSFSLYR
ncbi:T9SS type B sorting domain-containing protein [Poritiphilus flavus]|uniref:T9SS type B sorting domain-containing protein n=1 Tax=Poritiphilus flavus TaxID=2697053 RepID=A0A6L9EC05_9FLAO|nr:T9SS type B sorting domain-containing protein [Poritiphilus flavus]NAS12260.1 T9SS type B sorting domain-containing protein [Poritiphilus flavus]